MQRRRVCVLVVGRQIDAAAGLVHVRHRELYREALSRRDLNLEDEVVLQKAHWDGGAFASELHPDPLAR